MLKHVEDPSKLEAGMEIKVGKRYGRVIAILQHERYGTIVEYRDLWGGGIKMAQLAQVRIETKRRKVKGAAYAK